MNYRSVRVGQVYRWAGEPWRVVGRKGGHLLCEKVRLDVREGRAEFTPLGPRELLRPGELRPL